MTQQTNNPTLWSINEILHATGGEVVGDIPPDFPGFSGVAIDSRTIKSGEIFVALKGDNFDGHSFVQQVLQSGSVAAIVNQGEAENIKPEHGFLIEVPETLKALQAIGAYARKRSGATFIGITGSVGKTSTTRMMALGLSGAYRVHSPLKNFNNHIGLPLTLANMPIDTEYAVLEMGMNHAGEIDFLTTLAAPHIAIITAIAPAHLENFKDIYGIADTKAEIFNSPACHTAIIGSSTGFAEYLKRKAESRVNIRTIQTFGTQEADEFRLLNFSPDATGALVEAVIMGETIKYHQTGHARTLAINALAVLGVGVSHLDLAAIASRISAYEDSGGRGKTQATQYCGNQVFVVDDSYNASPASVVSALENLSTQKAVGKFSGRKVAILGDMLELGENAPKIHAELAESVALHKIDVVITVGELMSNLNQKLSDDADIHLIHFENSEDACKQLPFIIQNNDGILVKGSNGMKMNKIVMQLTASDVDFPQKQGAVENAV